MLQFSPEDVVIQILVLRLCPNSTTPFDLQHVPTFYQLLNITLPQLALRPIRLSCNLQQRTHKRLLDIRKGELIRDFGRRGRNLIRELNLFVVAQLLLPILAILDSLLEIRVREEILAIEAGRTLRNAWVESLEMVRAADHEDAFVRGETVHGVEEEAAHFVRDEAVEVLEHQVARGFLTRFREDVLDAILWRDEADERFDVERRHGLLAAVQGVHSGFDGDGLAVSWRAVENDAALPRHAETVVLLARVVEAFNRVDQVFLELFVQDDVLPAGFHDAAVQDRVLLPVALVEDPDFVVQDGLVAADRGHERAHGSLVTEDVLVADLRVRQRPVTAVDEVDEKSHVLPLVDVRFEEGFLGEDAVVAIEASQGRNEDGPSERVGPALRADLSLDGLECRKIGGGIGFQVAVEFGDNGDGDAWMDALDGVEDEGIGVDTASCGIAEESACYRCCAICCIVKLSV